MTVVSVGGAGLAERSDDRLANWWRGRMGRPLLTEVLIIGGLLLLYRQVRTLVRDEQVEAVRNASKVIQWERAVGLFNEMHLQRLFLGSREMVSFLDHYYVFVHFPVTAAVTAWVYVRRHELYARLKYLLISVTMVGLALHVAFPLAPPRMLDANGFVDTLQRYGPRIYAENPTESLANQFAAMPSLHFAWAMIVAITVISARTSKRPWLWVLHPVLTLIAIVATGNHFWIDAVVAAALVVLALGLWPALLAHRSRSRVPVSAA